MATGKVTRKRVRYYTGGAIVAGDYDILVARVTVDFSNGNAEPDMTDILSAAGYSGSVAGCFAMLGATPSASVLNACFYSSSTKKVALNARSLSDGSGLTAAGVTVDILLLVS